MCRQAYASISCPLAFSWLVESAFKAATLWVVAEDFRINRVTFLEPYLRVQIPCLHAVVPVAGALNMAERCLFLVVAVATSFRVLWCYWATTGNTDPVMPTSFVHDLLQRLVTLFFPQIYFIMYTLDSQVFFCYNSHHL